MVRARLLWPQTKNMSEVDNKQSCEPEVEFLPKVFKTPSRLNCRFGWGDVTTGEFLRHNFDQLVLIGVIVRTFVFRNLVPRLLR